MADVSIIEAISLLTKVSADNSKMLKSLTSSSGSKVKGGKEELVKKADPVIVTDFGKAAEKDLAKLGGEASKERERADKEKNKNNDLLKLLGLAGAAALAMKFLFDGEGFTGLVQGFQNATNRVIKFANKAKGLIDDVGKRLGTFTDDIGTRVGTIVDDVMAKTGAWAKSAKEGIKNAMDDIGKRLGTFGDDIARGLTAAVNSAKNIASRVAQTGTGVADDIARGATAGASGASAGAATPAKKPGLFSRVTSFVGDTAKKAGGFVADKAAKGKNLVVAGATKVADTTKAVGKFAKDKILKKFLSFLKFIKIGALLKGIAKSPLLAPVIESVFAFKDINKAISDYQEGEISKEELDAAVGNRTFKALGGLLGGAGGAALVASMMGGVSFGLAAPLGAIIGGILGDVGGRFVADKIAQALGDKVSSVGEFVLDQPLFANKLNESVEEIQDGIITKDGQVIKPDPNDTIYAMKDGGPLGEALNKTPIMLKSLIDLELDSLDLMREQNKILIAILNKNDIMPIATGNNTNVNNFDQSGDIFRQLQMS